MEVLTLYVGQGNFAVVRHGTQAIAVDTRWLAEQSDGIESTVDRFLQRRHLVGIVLTGLDDDHADPVGLDWLLENYTSDWVMYPKYFKDTENAKLVFNVIRKHEQRRQKTQNPLQRVSVRLDRLESRYLDDLSGDFQLERFVSCRVAACGGGCVPTNTTRLCASSVPAQAESKPTNASCIIRLETQGLKQVIVYDTC